MYSMYLGPERGLVHEFGAFVCTVMMRGAFGFESPAEFKVACALWEAHGSAASVARMSEARERNTTPCTDNRVGSVGGLGGYPADPDLPKVFN